MTAKAFLAGGLAAGLLALATPAQAGTLGIGVVFTSGGHHDQGRGYGYAVDPFRVGYNRGYEEGFDEGVKDARRVRRLDYRRHGDYRHGDRGYKRDHGPKPRYVAGFRNGFEDGYRRGYRSVFAFRHRHHGRSDWCYQRHDHGDRGYGYDNRYDRDRREWNDRGDWNDRRDDDDWRDRRDDDDWRDRRRD